MKQYYITSNYSLGLQIAVQQDHALKVMERELKKACHENSIENEVFNEYINDHETTICLGVSQPTEILALYAFIKKHEKILQIPKAIFQEPSMNYTPTVVSFVTNTKLSHPIARGISDILRNNNIYSFYDFTEEKTFYNHNNTLTVVVYFDDDGKTLFDVSFVRNNFKSKQNDEMIPKDLTDEYLDEVYKEHFREDYCFHNGLNPYKKDETEMVHETYTIEEIVFLDIISRFNLKK